MRTARRSTEKDAQKQAGTPEPVKESSCPRSAANLEVVKPSIGAEQSAETRKGAAARGLTAVNTPSETCVTTAGASRSSAASSRSSRQRSVIGSAVSMSRTRASVPGGTKAIMRSRGVDQTMLPKR